MIFILIAFAALHAAAQTAAKPAPNVVLITIDTLRADHLGCYGYKQIKTPNIDGLATDGVRFERAFTVVPVTLPSHTSILTGTYPMFSGMHDFSGNKLSPLQPTLASVLKQAGYQTGAVIASAVLDSRFGLNQGFDFYYDHFDFSRLDEANLDEMARPWQCCGRCGTGLAGEEFAEEIFSFGCISTIRTFLIIFRTLRQRICSAAL